MHEPENSPHRKCLRTLRYSFLKMQKNGANMNDLEVYLTFQQDPESGSWQLSRI